MTSYFIANSRDMPRSRLSFYLSRWLQMVSICRGTSFSVWLYSYKKCIHCTVVRILVFIKPELPFMLDGHSLIKSLHNSIRVSIAMVHRACELPCSNMMQLSSNNISVQRLMCRNDLIISLCTHSYLWRCSVCTAVHVTVKIMNRE